MKAAVILAVLAIACDAAAQNLPGPASGGWYVLMYENPNGGRYEGSGLWSYRCLAGVVPSSQSGKLKAGDNPEALSVSKRFGPYATRAAAYAALDTAGWYCPSDNIAGTCFADAGCQP
jgi:hypothetical protein